MNVSEIYTYFKRIYLGLQHLITRAFFSSSTTVSTCLECAIMMTKSSDTPLVEGYIFNLLPNIIDLNFYKVCTLQQSHSS